MGVQAKDVLEKGGFFSGINRKVQLKPQKWISQEKFDGDNKNAEGGSEGGGKRRKTPVTQALLILKWGGVLTAHGRKQSEKLGHKFRARMYPSDGTSGTL